jgi:hypothetical protein
MQNARAVSDAALMATDVNAVCPCMTSSRDQGRDAGGRRNGVPSVVLDVAYIGARSGGRRKLPLST